MQLGDRYNPPLKGQINMTILADSPAATNQARATTRIPKRGKPVECTTTGCTQYGSKETPMDGITTHVSDHRLRDDYFLALNKDNDELWRIVAHIPDNGANLALEGFARLAQDLVDLTAHADELNEALAG